ncbi:MAG TPA: hypothetical protein VFW96_17965, partial [Thermomicrobiales bacterium]|nr:hypothetical protein [Thermomicrobiales bacterium]
MSIEQSQVVVAEGARAGRAAFRPRARPVAAVWSFCRRKPLGTVGAAIILLLLVTAIFAEQIAPYAYDVGRGADRLQGPSPRHLLGTDNLGRDMFSRIVYGARISVAVGFGAVFVGTGLATLLGLISGYFGGLFDLLLQRLIDAWIAFPALVLLAVLVTVATTRDTS